MGTSYDPTSDFKIGSFIDAKDSVNNWWVARITNISDNKVTFWFDGWSNKWNDTHLLKGPKIAPFRRHSYGYTGQAKSAIRENAAFGAEKIQNLYETLETLIAGEWMMESAWEITQFYRGELFTFVDQLLTFPYSTVEDQEIAGKFFQKTLELIALYLKGLPNLLEDYTRGISEPESFYTDCKVALASCWPEIAITISRIFADDERCAKFFSQYDPFSAKVNPEEFKYAIDMNRVNKTLVKLVEDFGNLGGYDALIALTEKELNTPLQVLAGIPLKSISPYLSSDYVTSFLESVQSNILSRLSDLEQKEIRTIERAHFNTIIQNLGNLITRVSTDPEQFSAMELQELELALKFVKCDILEKRLKGVSDLRHFVAKTTVIGKYAKPKWLTAERLKEWFLERKVIELLVVDYLHAETIKRSKDIFIFLARRQSLSNEHLNLLLSNLHDKHDSVIRVVYKLIIDITPALSHEQCNYLFSALVDLDAWDEKYIDMMKNFSIKANEHNGPLEQYALPLLYEHLMDDSGISLSMFPTVLTAICDILNSNVYENERDVVLSNWFMNLIYNTSIPQMLTLAMSIFDSVQVVKTPGSRNRETREMLILRHNQKHELINSTIDNTTLYLSKLSMEINEDSSSLSDEVVKGARYSNEESLKIRLDFLTYLVHNSNFQLQITTNDIEHMWNLFIKTSQAFSVYFYNWLKAVYPRNSMYDYVLLPETMHDVFKQFFCDVKFFDPRLVDAAGFKCFVLFFEDVNRQLGNTKRKFKTQIKRMSENMLGYEQFWLIVLYCKEQPVCEKAMRRLIELQINVSSRLNKEKVWTHFIMLAFGQLAKRQNEDMSVKHFLELIIMLLDRFEGKGKRPARIPNPITQPIEFIRTDNNEKHILQIHSNHNISSVRLAVAKNFQISGFDLKLNGEKILCREHDHILFGSLGKVKCVTIQQKNSKELNFCAIISNYPENLDMLLQLISQTEKIYATNAWSLLMRLPTNKKMKESLRNLKFARDPANWSNMLDPGAIHKLLYSLIIIEELVETDKNRKWVEQFAKTGGINHLLLTFLQTTPNMVLGNNFISKYTSVFIGLISTLFSIRGRISGITCDGGLLTSKLLQTMLIYAKSANESQDIQQVECERIFETSCKLMIFIGQIAGGHVVQESIMLYSNMEELLLDTIIKTKHEAIGTSMASLIHSISYDQNINLQVFFSEQLRQNLPLVIANNKQPTGYFQCTRFLIENTKIDNLEDDMEVLSNYLRNQAPEKSVLEQDLTLKGILLLLSSMIKQLGSEKLPKGMIEFVIHDCLFDVPSVGETDKPKAKHPQTREEAFHLLEILMNTRENVIEILQFLDVFHKDPTWRTNKFADWSIHPSSMEKAISGYVGIKNLGNICYMNSMFQQLFMIHRFRDAILDLENPHTDVPHEDNLLYQLQYIFASLKESAKQYINPKDFCHSFKDWDGNPVNVMEQMDVEEFCNSFMDKIEGFTNAKHKNLVGNTFGGKLVTELIGQDSCKHRSEREEPLINIQLEVKNKKNILQSLDSFVEGEVLEKDNAYQCEHCDSKVKAVRRVCIKTLPNVLFLVMRRFEFDYDSMRKLKVQDRCEFPMELDMEPYTQEGIEARAAKRDETDEIKRKYPEDYYNYKLRGVVVHTGIADSGHYYSLIRDPTGQWLEFNDTIVTPFDPSDIPSEAFGGEESVVFNTSETSQVTMKEKTRNAYLLFYERDGSYDTSNTEEGLVHLPELEMTQPQPNNVMDIFNRVKTDNERYWRSRNSFSPEYNKFLMSLWNTHKFSPERKLDLFKFICNFYLTIMVRSKDRDASIELLQELRDSMDMPEAEWVLEVFSVSKVHKELLVDCPIADVRKFILILAKTAVERSSQEAKEKLLSYLLRNLDCATLKNSKHFAQFCHLVFIVVMELNQPYPYGDLFMVLASHVLEVEYSLDDIPELEFNHKDIYLGYDLSDCPNDFTEERSFFYENMTSYTYLVFAMAQSIDVTNPLHIEFIKDNEKIGKLCADAVNKIGAKAVSRFFYKFSDTAPEMVCQYIEALMDKWDKNDANDLKTYFRQFKHVMTYHSANKLRFISFGMDLFVQMMERNSIYYKATEMGFETFFKLAYYDNKVFDWIITNKPTWRWMDRWSKENRTPPVNNSRGVSMFKRQSYTPQNKMFKPNIERIDFLRLLSVGNRVGLSNYDSDIDITEMAFDPGDQVWVLDPTEQNYVKAKVDYVIDFMIKIRYDEQDKVTTWIDYENEFLIPILKNS